MIKAKDINPQKLYNLACVYSLQGKESEAQDCLKTCKAAGTLPSKNHLLEDSDLKPVTDKKWFKEFISDLPD